MAILLALPLLLPMQTHATQDKPNIILIVCDDLSDAIGPLKGHPLAKTPHLDRLAARGVSLTNAAANSPLCGPSRMSFLTGLLPHQTGYYGYNFSVDHWKNHPPLANAVTFVEYLRRGGYTTLGTGKIHHNNQEDWTLWDRYGYRHEWGPWPWDGTPDVAKEHGVLHDWSNSAIHPNSPPEFGIGDQFGPLSDVPDVKPNSEKGIPGYRGWRLFHKPFHYVNEDDRDLMPDELNAQWAEEQLKQARDKPFLMCIGMNRPHEPLFAPDKYFEMFPLEEIEVPRVDPAVLNKLPTALRGEKARVSTYGFWRYAKFMRVGGGDLIKKWLQAYLANVAFVDDQIGAVLDALEKSPYAQNTYVFVTSDNGYHLGEKAYIHKQSVWEESNRVPLIAAGPGVARNQTCDQPVSLVDLYPTFVDIAKLPDDPNRDGNKMPLAGHSLLPLMRDPAAGRWEGPEASLSVVNSIDKLAPGEPGKVERQQFTIRTRQFRYVLCDTGEEELYDHSRDPGENLNLVGEPHYDAERLRLRKLLLELTGRSESSPAAKH